MESTYEFSISKGALESALAAFTSQTGMKPQFTEALVHGATTDGLTGRFTAAEGLRRLVSGANLEVERLENGELALVATTTPRGRETVLPSVQVRSDAIGTHEISMEAVKRNLARDMADVYRNDPSIVVGGGARNAQRVYVRGVESTNLHVTIDGAKQGSSLHQHRGDIGAIEPALLKRVAVQTGSSADAGPGALGGSIRFETVDAQDLLQEGRTEGAMLRGGYGSVDESLLGSATAYALLGDKVGLLVNFSAMDRQDYTTGGARDAENTAGEDYDYFLKMSMLEQAGHSLRLSAEHKRDSGLYVWGGTGSDMGFATGVDPVRVSTERTSIVADHRFNPSSQYVDSRINLYYNTNSVENEDADSTYISDTMGGDIRNTFHGAIASIQNDLTAGFDGLFETNKAEVDSDDTENDAHNIGIYIQNRMSYGPARLSFGARLDTYEAEFGENSIDGSRVSPNAGLEYDVLAGLTAFANYGEAVRATGIVPGSWMANINAATKFSIESPESSRRYETGLRYNRQGLFLDDDSLRAGVTYFDSRMKNVITAQGGRGGVVRELMNSGPLFSKGWEARLGWGFEMYDTSLAYTHVTTRDENDDPVGVTRRLAASAGDRVVWDSRFNVIDDWTFGYTLTWVARLTDVPDGEEERPGYVLHAVQAAWEPEDVSGLTLSLAVRNLFDREYSEQTSIADSNGNVLAEPGRDIRVGFSYSF